MARHHRLPGEEVWLVGEWRSSGERNYHLANLPADTSLPVNTSLEALATLIEQRWACQQMHQQMKDALGLDHGECRSWQALHHHALLCHLAFAFFTARAARGEKAEWRARGHHRNRVCRRCAAGSWKAINRAVLCCPHCRREHSYPLRL